MSFRLARSIHRVRHAVAVAGIAAVLGGGVALLGAVPVQPGQTGRPSAAGGPTLTEWNSTGSNCMATVACAPK